MIAGLFFYIVSIFNIIYPFHIFLKLFSHKDFSPLFFRVLWSFYAISLLWMIFVPVAKSAVFLSFMIYPLWSFHIFFFFTEDLPFRIFLFFIFIVNMIFVEAVPAGILVILNFIFPQLHLAVLYVALRGNTISIALCSIFQIILNYLFLPRLFSLYSAFSSFDQFKIVSLSRDSCSFYDDHWKSVYVHTFSILFLRMVCYILSDHLCDHVEYVSSGYVVVKRIRETSFKRKTSTNALRRRNQASASS